MFLSAIMTAFTFKILRVAHGFLLELIIGKPNIRLVIPNRVCGFVVSMNPIILKRAGFSACNELAIAIALASVPIITVCIVSFD
jgi:hypothetical protein